MKNDRVQVIVETDFSHFKNIVDKMVEAVHLAIIQPEDIRSLPSGFMPPAIAEEHTTHVEKNNLYTRRAQVMPIFVHYAVLRP